MFWSKWDFRTSKMGYSSIICSGSLRNGGSLIFSNPLLSQWDDLGVKSGVCRGYPPFTPLLDFFSSFLDSLLLSFFFCSRFCLSCKKYTKQITRSPKFLRSMIYSVVQVTECQGIDQISKCSNDDQVIIFLGQSRAFTSRHEWGT